MLPDDKARDDAMAAIYRAVDRTRMRWRFLGVLGGLARTVLLLSSGLLLGFLAVRLQLPGGVWLGFVLTMLAALGFVLVRYVFFPMARPITDEMVARHLEEARPDLDNRIINAVLLDGEQFDDSLADRMVTSQLERTAQQVRTAGADQAEDTRGLLRYGPAAVVVTVVLATCWMLSPERIGLAWKRFVSPYARVARETLVHLRVEPGDTTCLQGSTLKVEAIVSGALPDSATIHWLADGGRKGSDQMPFVGSGFAYEFTNVQKGFTYRVEAGDAESEQYTVTICSRPAVERLVLTYIYPDYTALDPRSEISSTGDIRVPPGTGVRFAVTPDRPVRTGRLTVTYPPTEDDSQAVTASLDLEAGEDGVFGGKLKVSSDATYKIVLTDSDGVSNVPILRRIEAADGAPRVSLAEPAKDVSVPPDGSVHLVAAAEDDFNLRELQLVIQPRPGAAWQTAQSWTYKGETPVTREESDLNMAQLDLAVGDLLTYYIQAADGRPELGISRSRVYRVRIARGDTTQADSEQDRQALRAVVLLLLKLQKENLERTGDLAVWAESRPALQNKEAEAWDDYRNRCARLVSSEEDIGERADKACRAQPAESRSNLAEALGRLATGPINDATALLEDLKGATAAGLVPERSEAAQAKQEEVIALLERLLDDPAAVLAKLLRDQDSSEALVEAEEDLHDGKELAERMLRQLKDFRKDQEEVIALSNELAEKPVDDFTDEDEQKLRDVVEREKEWAKVFQEMATDLSKLPPQDHSLANQAKELLEVFSEVQQAAEEAERKAVEMAVPHEQAGTELAESIETNIEKWLMEDKDAEAWKMEDPLEDYETPMTELPDELQDLIGDLVEQEEDMLEQFDDATSGWMDSLDKGAGWDTTDGPISNMSAKGVTGNRLPNTSEIGGRSGEGRTGKSSGQFVEEEATGKGGRQTPSRMTPDPFEAGWVKDSSQEAVTGATGGGKVSGQGAEGFHGPVPPPLRQKLKRLAQQQQELIDKAKRLDYGLKKYRHPRGDLPQTIELMEVVKASLEEGEINTFSSYQRIVLSDLRDIKETSEKQKLLWRDRTAPLPKELRQEISSAEDERMPEQYRELIRSYSRSLAEGGS
jgi:hypothetical protein